MGLQSHVDLLGYKCQDKVTGFKGVITTIGFDLYGCVQAIVNPGLNEKGEAKDVCWFDIARLKITSKKPVMDQPDFKQGYIAEGKKGPSEKPSMGKA